MRTTKTGTETAVLKWVSLGQARTVSESFIQTTAVDNNNNLNETKLDLKEEA